jgi:hypothetical protein
MHTCGEEIEIVTPRLSQEREPRICEDRPSPDYTTKLSLFIPRALVHAPYVWVERITLPILNMDPDPQGRMKLCREGFLSYSRPFTSPAILLSHIL